MPSSPRTTPPIFRLPFTPAPIRHPPPIFYLDADTAAVGVRRQSRSVASPLRVAPAPCSCRLLRRRGRIGFRFHDAQVGADVAAAPVLELDLCLDELRRFTRVERIDQHAVFL